jgi:ring-1,2-phenylacetyl-CoA epoxidase subunit PaaA
MASNDDMRQQFLNQYVPKILELGLSIPDPNLVKNKEIGKWSYSDPDWNEFFEVIRGNGPCNKERLAVRRMAEENGAWVRKALNKNAAYTVPLS